MPQATYDEFTALLPEAECRYAVYDFSYVGKEGTWQHNAARFARAAMRIAPAAQRTTRARFDSVCSYPYPYHPYHAFLINRVSALSTRD
jgi:hypothetical protein